MHKTSVYLPEGLKAALSAFAGQTHRSEADLIRLAIERLVSGEPGVLGGSGGSGAAPGASGPPATVGRLGRATTPAAVRPSVMKGAPRIVAIGVGPGDPDLLTERALVALRLADRVFAPTTGADAIGRAEMVVRAVAPEVRVDRLEVAIAGDADARDASLIAAAEALIAGVDSGQVVAFVTLGDPNLYTTFPAIVRRLHARRPDVMVETVPGIMSFQELAARTGTVVVEGDDRVLIVSGADAARAQCGALADPRCALVVYKGGRHLPELAAELARVGRLDGAVVGEGFGLPGGRGVAVSAVADRPASYLATVVIPVVG